MNTEGISRIRSHRGNLPTLPQTKQCPLCSAKFTRTTHLNRHIRSHTNEREYQCDLCASKFTRSDLLTRHKRTCGDSQKVPGRRRKSCQACADSKVKCDLLQPCGKCSFRGRECVYVNDPTESRLKKYGPEADGDGLSTSPPIVLQDPSTLSPYSFGPSSSHHRHQRTSSLSDYASFSGSSDCSSNPSPHSEYFGSTAAPTMTMEMGPGQLGSPLLASDTREMALPYHQPQTYGTYPHFQHQQRSQHPQHHVFNPPVPFSSSSLMPPGPHKVDDTSFTTFIASEHQVPSSTGAHGQYQNSSQYQGYERWMHGTYRQP